MGVQILNGQRKNIYPEILNKYLPGNLKEEIEKSKYRFAFLEEIRLRANSAASLTTDKGNITLKSSFTNENLNLILAKMCGNSLYAHSESVNNGYITLDGGIRVGICGRASIENGKIVGVYDITGINIRLPVAFTRFGDSVCDILKKGKDGKGVLIYSPPGVGKTTLLRSVARKMATGKNPWRVAVVDTRGEINCFGKNVGVTWDILSGYPKGRGIEIAVRTMNAQLVVCDEIGDSEEANSIINVQNCGVPLLATAHGNNIEGLLSRPPILRLHRAHIFGTYVRIYREKFGEEFKYSYTTAEEADDILQNNRSIYAAL